MPFGYDGIGTQFASLTIEHSYVTQILCLLELHIIIPHTLR